MRGFIEACNRIRGYPSNTVTTPIHGRVLNQTTTMSTPTVPSSPAAIKKLEKQFGKEAKRENCEVKEALKAVQSIEKQKAKAQKVFTRLSFPA